MAEPHVVSALRAKRAEVSGYIHDLEKKIAQQRASLVHIDAAIRIFSPGTDPETIPPKRHHHRSRYFAFGDLPRLRGNAIRQANGSPVTALAIAEAVVAWRHLPDDDATKRIVADRVLAVLRSLIRRGTVVRHGEGRDAHWSLPGADLLDRCQ